MKKKKTVLISAETGEVVENVMVWTALNARKREKDYEKNTGVSDTIPGQTMTIQEMVARHRKGLPIDQSRGALYQGEELMPDIDKMDLVDRQAYMDSVADALVEVKARIQESVKTKREQEIIDKIDSAVRERLKLINAATSRDVITDLKEEK